MENINQEAENNPDNNLRKQAIKKLREQRDMCRIYGSIPEWLIDIKMRQIQQEMETKKNEK